MSIKKKKFSSPKHGLIWAETFIKSMDLGLKKKNSQSFANSPVVAEFSTLAILFSTLGLTGGERSWESRDGEAGRLIGRSRGKGPAQDRKKKKLVSVKTFQPTKKG